MEEELTFTDYWRIALKWKKTIALIVVSVTTLALVVSISMPNIYKADATIIPVGGQGGGGISLAAVAQMGFGGLLGGLASGTSESSKILAILKSRTLAERMIEKYDLAKALYPTLWDEKTGRWKVKDPKDIPNMESTVLLLQSKMTFNDNIKDKVVNVSAETINPQLSADLVNGYIRELSNHINESTFSTAKRNRIFIERQLEKNRMELLESGIELSEFYSVNKISNVVPNLDVDVSLSSMSQDPHDKSPTIFQESLGVPAAFVNVQAKSEDLQKKANEIQAEMDKIKVVKNVPQQVYLQYVTLKRELLRQINTLLTQQYEMAKIDEVKEDLSFQVIDAARVPVAKCKPVRRLIVMSSFMLSIFVSLLFVFFIEYLRKIRLKEAYSG